jgi:ribonuclease HII
MAVRETKEQKLERLTQLEMALWANGRVVAGIDEVGRGPLAGPVVTACVSIPKDKLVYGVDDSKKLSEKKREMLFDQLREAADYCEVAFVGQADIDGMNILNATKWAMEKCAAGFTVENGIILIDAVKDIKLPCEARSLVHGDALSYMIGAASIIAKVTRDRYMIELDAKYPEYAFARNKGYGTAEHIAAIKKYGPCPEHRLTFIKNFI